jgi:hypothetical protein
MYAVVARINAAQREQQTRYRVLDRNGEHTLFIGTIEECNAKFGDKDVTYVKDLRGSK